MNNDLEKAREALRQQELRIDGILQFSTEIDNKGFRFLNLCVIVIAILMIGLLVYPTMGETAIYTIAFSLSILFMMEFFLFRVVRAAAYKGVGLPAKEFNNNDSLEVILSRCGDRYETRFKNNRDLNHNKNFWLKCARYTFIALPLLSGLFYFVCRFMA